MGGPEPNTLTEPTAATICRALDRNGRRGGVDRSRLGVNVPAATPLAELRFLLGSGAIGAVLVWEGRRLVGLIDRARLARYEVHRGSQQERHQPREFL